MDLSRGCFRCRGRTNKSLLLEAIDRQTDRMESQISPSLIDGVYGHCLGVPEPQMAPFMDREKWHGLDALLSILRCFLWGVWETQRHRDEESMCVVQQHHLHSSNSTSISSRKVCQHSWLKYYRIFLQGSISFDGISPPRSFHGTNTWKKIILSSELPRFFFFLFHSKSPKERALYWYYMNQN